MVFKESMFTLMFAEKHRRQSDQSPWSVRRTFVLHRYRWESRPGLLLMVSSSDLIVNSASNYLDQHRSKSLSDSVTLDLLLLSAATSTWRPYFIWLARAVRRKVCTKALKTSPHKLILFQADRAIVADFDDDSVRLSRLEEEQSLKVLRIASLTA